MNSLHCWAMSGYLPNRGFKWLKNVANSEVNLVSEIIQQDILEVDLEYSE